MALVFVHHVIGDLTVGKPYLAEFNDSDTVESAINAIGECAEGAITVWRKRKDGELRLEVENFVGVLNSFDVVAFIAKVGDHERALKTKVAEVVEVNPGLLKEVDPGTRLIDALEMMKNGVHRLLIRKSLSWNGAGKRFPILYNGKWLNTQKNDPNSQLSSSSLPVHSDNCKYCLLSREDIIRFLIGCLGALAPIPLSSISSLGAITLHYSYIEASSRAIEAVHKIPQDPCAVAVIETNPDGTHKIVGEISSYKLLKCDYLAVAWAMANLTAGEFVMGVEDNNDGLQMDSPPTFSFNENGAAASSPRTNKFSSRSIGFLGNIPMQRSMYRGRGAPLTCKPTSSLAAVMVQLLSHRATHVWVTKEDGNLDEGNKVLVGVVGYGDILRAVTKHPGTS